MAKEETTRAASCACGAVQLAVRGESPRVSMCHCGVCKRRTGSAFSINATWNEDQVAVVGDLNHFERYGEDGGNWVREYFCATCGMRMLYRLELRPGMVSIPVGLFADPDFPPPALEFYGDLAMTAMTVTIEPPPEQL